MEKFVKKSKTERFAPLAASLAVVAGGTAASIKFAKCADKAAANGNLGQAMVYKTASSVSGWIAGITAVFVAPGTISGAIKSTKPSCEYTMAVNRICDEANAKVLKAEIDHALRISSIEAEANTKINAL